MSENEAGFPSDYEVLLALATELADLREPSVEAILRKRGFGYEAAIVQRLVALVDKLNEERGLL